MPVYDYECSECGVVFEAINSISNNFTECPKCGGNGIKLFSVSGQHIKTKYIPPDKAKVKNGRKEHARKANWL